MASDLRVVAAVNDGIRTRLRCSAFSELVTLTRRSEHAESLSSKPNAFGVLPSAPVVGEAKPPVLQDFPGGRAAYAEIVTVLNTPCWLWQGATHPKGYACRELSLERRVP